ncbi:MAG: hypothetical protein M3Q52_11745 [Pseudomonadota bacterium]|nr:hypothetical protein [Pseudomonadota bacterium]
MRRIFAVTLALLVAGCAGGQRPVPVAPRAVVPVERGVLIGLTAPELLQRFGAPALQVREGPGLKIQFRGARCVVDAYLYRPVTGQGVERVTHVDTRLPNGTDIDQPSCLATLQGA